MMYMKRFSYPNIVNEVDKFPSFVYLLYRNYDHKLDFTLHYEQVRHVNLLYKVLRVNV